MAFNEQYRRQVELLVRILPHVAEEGCFGLKGGTAINLFVRDMPRLSVDIDLTYLPIEPWARSLAEIDAALKRIESRIQSSEPDARITRSTPASQDEITKLLIRSRDGVQIKIEVTPVLRGAVYEAQWMPVSQSVEDDFGFAEAQVLSFADLYAGKIIAALDRQHPRDLFDVHHLLATEGINESLRAALIVYLVSHDHSPHSLLDPIRKDITQDFMQSFAGMADDGVTLEQLIEAREQVIADVVKNMPDSHKQFLRSFYQRKPDWELVGLQGAEKLPAVRWRELNLDRSGEGTCDAILRKLENVI
ncbi:MULTISPECIES: nucleotidyl transferase AbiEii/AbiGii toxin family protein [Halomonadaceae]|uniref:Nucleotidyl transferase AbiEii/AbiGii toxin family protein n=1 Tax=Vreelandella halophila TaxID=86177 RepID=A0A9X4Y7U7_9GAMM|nr:MULTISPECIES: nucleotidyl transferase AbiEii/AbiGii toxin family protein [Halomonas]MYL25174.1 nucleotidyl transferase AbiEii/AbiGii toxin family protein [Halomonas utahensis]MYL75236.1 nucleotidyl transferase AbiEii/AbiGii toxin family protein [Halomonas sp. 22501_18_FS]